MSALKFKETACTCEACIAACKRSPGWFLPGEAEKAAVLLRMPFDEFRERYLIRDYWCGKKNTYVLAPRKSGFEQDRTTASYGYAFEAGRCVFLADLDRCSIHAAKPFECRAALCCGTIVDGMREYVVRQWKKIGGAESWKLKVGRS